MKGNRLNCSDCINQEIGMKIRKIWHVTKSWYIRKDKIPKLATNSVQNFGWRA
jgi:hypothetical protein